MRLPAPVKNFLLFFPPLALWCFLYRGFFWGDLIVSGDTFAVYALIKYFFANLSAGVFPHWDPYLHWGMGHICQFGELNPVWLFILPLNALGLDLYHAFVWVMAAYYFIGVAGVYCLLRRFFEQEFPAYFGSIIFLFSGVGMTVFTQVTPVLVFVPAIWFFYFLADFYRTKAFSSVLFLCLTFMLVAATYIPFYFVTVLLCVSVFGTFFYSHIYRTMFIQAVRLWRDPKVLVLALAAAGAAVALPLFNWSFLTSDFVVLARPAVMNYDWARDAGLPIAEIARDPSLFHMLVQALHVPVLTYAREIFSLGNIPFDDQRMFFIPVLTHLVLFVSLFTRLNRRTVFWGSVCFALFLVALARLTPVYSLLFTYVPFFQTFRNIFFLVPFVTVLYLLLMLEQLRLLWFNGPRKHYGYVLWSAFVLAVFVLVWCGPGYTLRTTYICAGAFFLLLLLRFLGLLGPQDRWGMAVLVFLAVLQPLEVLTIHAGQFKKMERAIGTVGVFGSPLGRPEFAYTRPEAEGVDYGRINAADIYRLSNWHIAMMKDAKGFFNIHYGYPTRWSHALAGPSPEIAGFAEYVQHKFVVYDRFDTQRSFASEGEFAAWFARQPAGIAIDSPGHGLTVERFNANQVFLKTDFPGDKFLVYNDSYHPQWKAYINGRQVPLYRANFAFKGVRVPAGEQHLRFEFEPAGGSILYAVAMVFFYAYFILGTGFLLSEKRKHVRL